MLTFLLGLSCFLLSASPSNIEKLTETADAFYQAGKPDSALWAIDQAIQQALTERIPAAWCPATPHKGHTCVLPERFRKQ